MVNVSVPPGIEVAEPVVRPKTEVPVKYVSQRLALDDEMVTVSPGVTEIV